MDKSALRAAIDGIPPPNARVSATDYAARMTAIHQACQAGQHIHACNRNDVIALTEFFYDFITNQPRDDDDNDERCTTVVVHPNGSFEEVNEHQEGA